MGLRTFFVEEGQREEGILIWNYFFRREKEKGNGLRVILSQKAKGKKGVGFRIICPCKREKKSKVKQVRQGLRRRFR